MKQLVFLATYWGTKHGGVNAFNFDLCQAVADHVPKDTYQVVCVALQPDTKAESQVEKSKVKLIRLNIEEEEFKIPYANLIKDRLYDEQCYHIEWWIGHDVFSGPIAFKLKELHQKIYETHSSKVALIHHMDYESYKCYQQAEQNDIKESQRNLLLQKQIFPQADAVLAVGPKLEETAEDLIEKSKDVTSLVPGLISLEGGPRPNVFKVITAGRLEQDQDRIKQLTLSAKAFGKAYNSYKSKRQRVEVPKMVVYGIAQKEDSKRILNIIAKAAESFLPANAFEYTEDREELWSEMRKSSVCLMPSIYEGFGLIAWEAIGLEVPVILTKNSGVSELLYQRYGEYFEEIEITGREEHDLETLAASIEKVYLNQKIYKDNAKKLKAFLLKEGYTWEKTANALLKALKDNLKTTTNQMSEKEYMSFEPKVLLGGMENLTKRHIKDEKTLPSLLDKYTEECDEIDLKFTLNVKQYRKAKNENPPDADAIKEKITQISERRERLLRDLIK